MTADLLTAGIETCLLSPEVGGFFIASKNGRNRIQLTWGDTGIGRYRNLHYYPRR
jgi:hypothetical protein